MLRRFLLHAVLGTTTLLVAVPVTSQAPPAPGAVLYEGARLIPGDGKPAIEQSALLVENGMITASAPREASPRRRARSAST